MKKIGIMTMHRVVNYGSFLQAFGLKKMLEELGTNVEFVDYKYEGALVEKKKRNIISKLWKYKNFPQYFKVKNKRHEFKSKYVEEYLPMIGVSNKKNYNHNIDTLIIGSDEVFNCLQTFPVGYSRELFGKGFKNVSSYAASFGFVKYKMLEEYGIKDEITKLLSKFNNISVRDENSYNIINNLLNKKPQIHLDPVLVSNLEDTSPEVLTYKIKNYIIVYAYDGRLSKVEEKQIKKFAKKNHKKIVSLGFYQKIADYNLVVNPFEVISYFKQADFVITDTFHGTIFSIIANTNFCTLIRDSNRNKIGSLLDALELNGRSIKNIEDLEKMYNSPADFTLSNKKRKEERKKTIEYLEKII